MEAVEFVRTLQRLCEGKGCDDCPLHDIDICDVRYVEDPEEMVRIVEEWEKEHPEETDVATIHKNGEPCVKTIQDELEGVIYRAISSHKTRIENLEYDVSVIRHNLSELYDKTYALSENVDHTPATEPSQTPEQKRTNKDVLMAAFPNARMGNDGIPYACPNRLDAHYNCDKFENCLRCRHTHWLAEIEEK